MKKGKWNYSEDIEYKVVVVKLHSVPETPMHWQNAIAGQERQVVEVHSRNNTSVFHIDNQDGSALLKISKGGGPDSYSAHVGEFELIRELPEEEWQKWDAELHLKLRAECEAWQKENHPEQFEKLQSLIRSMESLRSGDSHIDKTGAVKPGKRLVDYFSFKNKNDMYLLRYYKSGNREKRKSTIRRIISESQNYKIEGFCFVMENAGEY